MYIKMLAICMSTLPVFASPPLDCDLFSSMQTMTCFNKADNELRFYRAGVVHSLWNVYGKQATNSSIIAIGTFGDTLPLSEMISLQSHDPRSVLLAAFSARDFSLSWIISLSSDRSVIEGIFLNNDETFSFILGKRRINLLLEHLVDPDQPVSEFVYDLEDSDRLKVKVYTFAPHSLDETSNIGENGDTTLPPDGGTG